eukprot:7467296-Alexandrium_andersonii.AAC.1
MYVLFASVCILLLLPRLRLFAVRAGLHQALNDRRTATGEGRGFREDQTQAHGGARAWPRGPGG